MQVHQSSCWLERVGERLAGMSTLLGPEGTGVVRRNVLQAALVLMTGVAARVIVIHANRPLRVGAGVRWDRP